jgi:DNA-directed RNA polymerase III subunit RPC4
LFQFPQPFPSYLPPPGAKVEAKAEPDVPAPPQSEEKKDIKPKVGAKDVKPSAAALRKLSGKTTEPPRPQGRVGSLVVMKSGKVKVVMGQDIVMSVCQVRGQS